MVVLSALTLFCTHPACASLNSSEGHLFLKLPSWKSPFPAFSSPCMPRKVTFLEISTHCLHFSRISLAKYVGHMQVVFLRRLSAGCLSSVVCLHAAYCMLVGDTGARANNQVGPSFSDFFSDRCFEGFFCIFTSFVHPFLKVCSSNLHPFFGTYFREFFFTIVHLFYFLLFRRNRADTHST